MRAKSVFRSAFWPSLAAASVLAVAATVLTSATPAPAFAQPSPMPQECVCSRGVNLAAEGTPVMIRHCQCGILYCAVVVNSGRLQCTK